MAMASLTAASRLGSVKVTAEGSQPSIPANKATVIKKILTLAT